MNDTINLKWWWNEKEDGDIRKIWSTQFDCPCMEIGRGGQGRPLLRSQGSYSCRISQHDSLTWHFPTRSTMAVAVRFPYYGLTTSAYRKQGYPIQPSGAHNQVALFAEPWPWPGFGALFRRLLLILALLHAGLYFLTFGSTGDPVIWEYKQNPKDKHTCTKALRNI